MRTLIPASNEPSGCEADIHDNRKFIFYCMANAARVTYPVACSGVFDFKKMRKRILSWGSTAEEVIILQNCSSWRCSFQEPESVRLIVPAH